MTYDAPYSVSGAGFAHLPIYGLEDLGFVGCDEAGRFIAERNTSGVGHTACRGTHQPYRPVRSALRSPGGRGSGKPSWGRRSGRSAISLRRYEAQGWA
jgi:hypothetical protein